MLDELMPLQVYYFGGVNLVRTLVLTVDRDNDPLNCSGEEFFLNEGEAMHPGGGFGSLTNKFYFNDP